MLRLICQNENGLEITNGGALLNSQDVCASFWALQRIVLNSLDVRQAEVPVMSCARFSAQGRPCGDLSQNVAVMSCPVAVPQVAMLKDPLTGTWQGMRGVRVFV